MTTDKPTKTRKYMTDDEKNKNLALIAKWEADIGDCNKMYGYKVAKVNLMQTLKGKPKFWNVAFKEYKKVWMSCSNMTEFSGETQEECVKMGYCDQDGNNWSHALPDATKSRTSVDCVTINKICDDRIAFARLLDTIIENNVDDMKKLTKKSLLSTLSDISKHYLYHARNGRFKGERLFTNNIEMVTYNNSSLESVLKYAKKNTTTHDSFKWNGEEGSALEVVVKPTVAPVTEEKEE